MLGMAVYLKKYATDRTNNRVIWDAEQAWVEKNKKWVTSKVPPSKILIRYCQVAHIPID